MTDQPGPQIAYHCDPALFTKSQMVHLEDCALVEQTLDGRALAYEVLVERYTPMVIGYLYHRTRGEDDVEDLAQEIFLTAYRGLANLKSARRFGPWLMRITRNRLIDYYRRSKDSRLTISVDATPGEASEGLLGRLMDRSPDPGRQAAFSQTRAVVLGEIERMNPNYRVIVYGRLVLEESNQELARRLGLKECTIRMRLFRGLMHLRKALKKKGVGPGMV